MSKFMKELFSWIISLGLAIILALLIKHYIFEVTIVRQSSMSDTFLDGEILLASKWNTTDLHRGDVIVLRNPDPSSNHTFMIKRVIGLPEDTLQLQNDLVLLNGNPLEEPYVKGEVTPSFGAYSWEILPDQLFVMGDNRSFSMDSRSFGPIPLANVSSKVFFRIFPFNRFGSISLPEVWKTESE